MRRIILLQIFFSTGILFASAELEVGAKLGAGAKGKDRFDSSLASYKSNSSPNVVTHTSLQPAKNLFLTEIYLQKKISHGHKLGFSLGEIAFSPFSLVESNSIFEFTILNFHLNSRYLLATYHYEFPMRRIRRVSLQTGIGLGVGQSILGVSGRYLSPFSGYNSVGGNLSGMGLHYKMEAGIKKQMDELTGFELGVMVGMITISQFEGSIGGASSSFYVQGDGSLSSMNSNQYANYVYSNQNYARKLDMQTSFISLYLAGNMFF